MSVRITILGFVECILAIVLIALHFYEIIGYPTVLVFLVILFVITILICLISLTKSRLNIARGIKYLLIFVILGPILYHACMLINSSTADSGGQIFATIFLRLLTFFIVICIILGTEQHFETIIQVVCHIFHIRKADNEAQPFSI